MCTAVSLNTADHYFGRNFDLEYSYKETVTITPRNFPLIFRKEKSLKSHYAMIGMAYVADNYPLYYDAVNEKGLSMAGLNFPGSAEYFEEKADKSNIAPFEFIPWILSQCADMNEAKGLLKNISIANIDFSKELPSTPLHWMISDKNASVTVESTERGLEIYDNPIGVLTNNPPFDIQLYNLNNYMALSVEPPKNNFSKETDFKIYSRGMGAIGLPGDLSSQSRFVKAAFTKLNSVCGDTENESVSQFFHILDSVEQQRGCVRLGDKYEITIYASCCNTDKGIYYYKTYENSAITGVDMRRINLDGKELVSYDLLKEPRILIQN